MVTWTKVPPKARSTTQTGQPYLIAAITRYYRLGGFTQHMLMISWFSKSEDQNRSQWAKTKALTGLPSSLEAPEGESISLPFPPPKVPSSLGHDSLPPSKQWWTVVSHGSQHMALTRASSASIVHL